MTRISRMWVAMIAGAFVASIAFAQEQNVTAASAATPVADGPAPKVKLSDKELNFGTVWVGSEVKKEFTITNEGEGPLTLSIKCSCGCTTPSRPKSPLAPGESTNFTISFSTKAPTQAHKKCTITTNDPQQAQWVIDVVGEVKSAFEATPRNLTFVGITANTEESRTTELVNNYEKPIELKLKEGQDFGKFDIELKEVEKGKKYELRATTKPPLTNGRNFVRVKLETGVEEVPEVEVAVTANVMPRVSLLTSRIFVLSTNDQEKTDWIRVRYKADQPLKITGVDAPEGFTCEIVPSPPPPASSQAGTAQVKVTTPPFDKIQDGAKIVIHTDDAEFKDFTVPIVKRVIQNNNRAVVRQPGAQPQDAPPIARQTKPTLPPAKNANPPSAEEIRKKIQEALAGNKTDGGSEAKKPENSNGGDPDK